MKISKKIKLGTSTYFMIVDVEYRKVDGYTTLCLKNCPYDYYDGGDFSIIVEKLEKRYNADESMRKKYDKDIFLLNDVIYLYQNAPFISGVSCIYSSKSDYIHSFDYISREEIIKYM